MKKHSIVSLFLGTLILCGGYGSAQTSDAPTTSPLPSIVDIAASNPEFSTLVELLSTANLVDTLAGPGSFTVFAPTNDAFAALPADVLATLRDPASVETLTEVLLYHVVRPTIPSSALSEGAVVNALNGDPITITSLDPVTINGYSQVVLADVVASNGIIHVINGVLIPPNNAYSVTSTSDSSVDSTFAVSYSCMFDNHWSASNHPNLYPSDAHWSPPLLATHEFAYNMWSAEGMASPGVEAVAESGDTSTLISEIENSSSTGSYVMGVVTFNSEVQSQTFPPIEMTPAHHYLSTITMAAPSPDWFSGFYDYSAINQNTQTWYNSFVIDTYPWDAGTEDGNTYSTDNHDTHPQQPITRFDTDTVPSTGVWLNSAGDAVLPVATWTCNMRSIVDIAVGNPDFSTLVNLLSEADLVGTLQGDGPFTVFAPTDAAFALLPPEVVESLTDPANVDALTNVLLYHVVGTRIPSSILSVGTMVDALNGVTLTVTSMTPPTINDSEVIATDIMASNGIIHVIDAVLIPPEDPPSPPDSAAPTATPLPSIVDIAASNPDFSILVSLLSAAGLVETLQGDGPFTVFAPTNAAFGMLPDDVVMFLTDSDNVGALQDVLLYHVVGASIPSSILSEGTMVDAVNGAALTVTSMDPVTINESVVTTADIMASNGIIHVIDAVLIPPDFSMPEQDLGGMTLDIIGNMVFLMNDMVQVLPQMLDLMGTIIAAPMRLFGGFN